MGLGYCALFVPEHEEMKLKKGVALEKDVLNKHVTYSFGVSKEEAEAIMPLGTVVEVTVTGYAMNTENAGYRVKEPAMYENSKNGVTGVTPHITTSLSSTGKAVNTCNLEFKQCKQQFKIKCVYGYYDFDTHSVLYK